MSLDGEHNKTDGANEEERVQVGPVFGGLRRAPPHGSSASLSHEGQHYSLRNRSSIRLRYGSPPDHPESTGWSACAKEPGIRREMKPENPDAELTFGEALRLSVPAERAAYLDQACGGNQAFRQKMESLLSAHAQAGDFLNQTRPLPASDVLIERTGTMVGRYKLLEQIGEGGFGVVWMAEQEEPVRRRVALKIIKLGMDSKEVVARFDAERQALAIMDHPNIATVFDGGTTDTGRPYLDRK